MSYFNKIKIQAWDGSDWVDVQSDAATAALACITYEHHEIHNGDSFVTDTVDADMGNGATLILAFRTPNTAKWSHMIVGFGSKAAAHLDVIEGPTWNNQSGAQNPIYNRDRNSATSSTLLEDQSGPAFSATDNVILNPTGLAGGTIIHDLYTWSDKKVTTKDRDQAEIILDQDTQYAIRLTADAATNAGQVILNWYEHTNL